MLFVVVACATLIGVLNVYDAIQLEPLAGTVTAACALAVLAVLGSSWRLSRQIEANDKTSDKFDAAATEPGLDTADDLGPRPRLDPNLKQPGEKENVTCESLFAQATELKPSFEERVIKPVAG